MPQIAQLTLHNGTAAVTFSPAKHTWENGFQVVEYLQATAGLAAILRAKIRIEFKQPAGGRNGLLRYMISVPTQETVSGTSDQGYVAPAKVAFKDIIKVEHVIPERSSAASRVIAMAYLNRILGQGAAVAINDRFLTGALFDATNAVGTNVYQSLEGFY